MRRGIELATRFAAVGVLFAIGTACGDDGGATTTVDAGVSCPRGFVECTGTCVATDNDPANCGACGTACATGELCSTGVCASSCMGGTTDCSGTCVETDFDPTHCGTCGTACATGEVCSAGACALGCSGGTTKCGTACVNTDADPAHCGGCDAACGTDEVCSGGSCGLHCVGGTTDCGGTCVDTQVDPAYCGGCATACPSGEVCSSGLCGLECTGGATLCGTVCADMQVDPMHCGGCPTACGTGEVCNSGVCELECVGGTTLCGGACVDADIDPNNCGGCGVVCREDEACGGGTCDLMCGFDPCGANEQIWSKGFSASDIRLYNAAFDSEGNVIIGGIFRGTVNLGGADLSPLGNWDSYLAKYDRAGKHLWSFRAGGTADERYGYDVEVDSADNIVVTGWFNGQAGFGGATMVSAAWDALVAKYDSDGNHLWSRKYGGTGDDVAYSVTVDASDNLIVNGYFRNSVDFGGGAIPSAGLRDAFVMKLDGDGNHLWSKGFGDGADQESFDNTVDGAGDIYLVGHGQGTMNFGGATLGGAGSYDNFVAKFDEDGNHIWSQMQGDGGDSRGYVVQTDSSDNVVIGGIFTGSIDYGGGALTGLGSWDGFLAKLDSNGAHLWSNRYGDAADDRVFRMVIDSDDNVIFGTLMAGTVDYGTGPIASAGSWDAYYAVVDSDGGGVYAQRFGDGNQQHGHAIDVDGEGRILLAGHFLGRIDLGWGPYATTNWAGFVGVFATGL